MLISEHSSQRRLYIVFGHTTLRDKMETLFNQSFIDILMKKAESNPRRRQNYDLRNSAEDTSQRMMNALLPGTQVPIHRHDTSAETVICLCGRLEEIIYQAETSADGSPCYKEISRCLLCPAEGKYGIQIPMGVWHSIVVHEPSVIFEAKDGAYTG